MPVTVSGLVMTGAGSPITMSSGPVAVPAALLALITAVKLPETVGVPEINPVPAFKLKPEGNPVAV